MTRNHLLLLILKWEVKRSIWFPDQFTETIFFLFYPTHKLINPSSASLLVDDEELSICFLKTWFFYYVLHSVPHVLTETWLCQWFSIVHLYFLFPFISFSAQFINMLKHSDQRLKNICINYSICTLSLFNIYCIFSLLFNLKEYAFSVWTSLPIVIRWNFSGNVLHDANAMNDFYSYFSCSSNIWNSM